MDKAIFIDRAGVRYAVEARNGEKVTRAGASGPLLVAAKRRDVEVSRDEVISYISKRVATWWTPDEVVFLDELPHTATGKVHKLALRNLFSELRFLDTVQA